MRTFYLILLLLITLSLSSFSKTNVSNLNSETAKTILAKKQSQNLTAISLFDVTYLSLSCGFILVTTPITSFQAIALQAWAESYICNPPLF